MEGAARAFTPVLVWDKEPRGEGHGGSDAFAWFQVAVSTATSVIFEKKLSFFFFENCSVFFFLKIAQSCPGLYSPWNSPGQNTGVSSLSLLQGISPTQGSNPGLLHWGQILYQLSRHGFNNF